MQLQAVSDWTTLYYPLGAMQWHLVPTRKLSDGAMVYLLPDTTKNKKGGHCSVSLTCDVLCFTTWLQLVTYHYAAAGRRVTNFFTRPLAVGTKQFAEKSMTCSNAWACLTMYLKSLGMYTARVYTALGGAI